MTTTETPLKEHEIRRSGWWTSEFCLVLLSIVAAVVPYLGDAAAAAAAKSPYAALAPAIAAGAYALGRALVKKSRNDASAVVNSGPETVNAGTANINAAPSTDTATTAPEEPWADGPEEYLANNPPEEEDIDHDNAG